MDRQRVDAAREFRRQQLINHAVTFDPALPAESFRHDMNPEMGLAARPVSGVSHVILRLVLDVQALRRKRGVELFGDLVFHQHGVHVRDARSGVNRRDASHSPVKTFCQDLKVSFAAFA